jgi:hypothetical protein
MMAKNCAKHLGLFATRGPRAGQNIKTMTMKNYPSIAIRTPAATAEPMTPEMLLAMQY